MSFHPDETHPDFTSIEIVDLSQRSLPMMYYRHPIGQAACIMCRLSKNSDGTINPFPTAQHFLEHVITDCDHLRKSQTETCAWYERVASSAGSDDDWSQESFEDDSLEDFE